MGASLTWIATPPLWHCDAGNGRRPRAPTTWGNRGSESPLRSDGVRAGVEPTAALPIMMVPRGRCAIAGLGAGDRRTKKAEYVGLDVSMKETAVSIRRDGKRIWRGQCASDPKILAEVIRRRAPDAARVVFETGPLSMWFYHALTAEGLPAICIDARHAKAALDMAPNKTDANDADGLAQLAEVGFFREVRVKGFDSMLARALVAVRNRLVQITTELSNQIRGLMKTVGLLVPAGKGSKFEEHVRALLEDQAELARIILPVLEAWRGLRRQAA